LHPELFRIHIGGYERPINSYGVMIILGVTAGIWLSARRAPRFGIPRFDEFAIGLIGFCGGIVGAVALYVAIHLRTFLDDPSLLQSPGMVFYGGFAGGALAVWIYCRAYRISIVDAGDAGAPGLALGHAFGRVGCWLGGCCWGRDGHPVQLYEAGALVVLSALLLVYRPARRGLLLTAYIGGYALIRLCTEHFRGDDVERGIIPAAGLSTSQALAALALIGAVIMLLRSKKETAHGGRAGTH
jgi:phosphatidylglycerol---prolipoprotein diacylglyceryl transferase